MSDTPNVTQFRTALHGFNREDVVAFIEKLTNTHRQELNAVEEENERLRSALEQASRAASDENEQLVNELKETAGKLRAENDELRRQLQEAQTRAQEVKESKPAAPAFSAPMADPAPVEPRRDYSEMELAAYRRAEVMERLARDRSQTIYRQVQSVFSNGASKLEIGQNDLAQLTKTLEMDVSQLIQLLARLRGAFSETEESFRVIGDQGSQFADSL